MELMAKRVALITGVTGQDGAYLAEFLLNKGCRSWPEEALVLVQHRAGRSSLLT
jgi:hypothetical protein